MIIIDPSAYIACKTAEERRIERNRPEVEDEFYRTHASNGLLRAAALLLRVTRSPRELQVGLRRQSERSRLKSAQCAGCRGR